MANTDKSKIERVAVGLLIISRYAEDGHDIAAQHDVIYAGDPKMKDKMKPEEVAELEELGWTWQPDGEAEGFYIFV